MQKLLGVFDPYVDRIARTETDGAEDLPEPSASAKTVEVIFPLIPR